MNKRYEYTGNNNEIDNKKIEAIEVKQNKKKIEPIIKPVLEDKPLTIISLKCNAALFKKVIALQASITDDARIRFYKDKIEFRDVDPAHVIMVKQIIPDKSLIEYTYNFREEYYDLGISLDKLNDMLKASDKKDIITLTYLEDSNDLNISYGLYNYKLNIILDVDSLPDPKQPVLNLPATFTIDSKTFKTFIDQANKISDHMSISTSSKGLNLFAANDTDNINADIDASQLKDFSSNSKHKSLFANDYLASIFKHIIKLFKEVKIKIGDDNPLEISGDELTYINVLLAPRMEEA